MKTYMFIEYDELWYGRVQTYQTEQDLSFRDIIETILSFASDSIIDCYIVTNNFPHYKNTYFCISKKFQYDEFETV